MIKQIVKRFLIILLIAITCFSTFTSNCFISYAEDIYYMTDEELDACFTAYLQSRGGNVITTLPTRLVYTDLRLKNFIQSPSNTTGVNTMEQVRTTARFYRAGLNGAPDNAGTMLLAISQPSFWGAYTDWLMQKHFLGPYTHFDENGLLATDTNQSDANIVYSGKYVTDDNGKGAMVWIIPQLGTPTQSATINAYGSYYLWTHGSIMARVQQYSAEGRSSFYTTARWNNSVSYQMWFKWTNHNGDYSNVGYAKSQTTGSFGIIDGNDVNGRSTTGYPIIFATTENSNVGYIGVYQSNGLHNWVTYDSSQVVNFTGSAPTGGVTAINIGIDFSPTYNNNITRYPDINATGKLYIQPRVKVNGEFKPVTNINDYRDNSNTERNTKVIIDVNPPSTSPLPDVGGGDSTAGGDYGGTGEDGTINYPDFNFNLPDIDWSIDGLSEKFPFSIPFDLMAMFEVLNAEPQTPEIQAQIDLKVVTWDIDYDLHDFDGVAEILRNLEFIAFCIGLILITRSLIKG